MFFSHKQLLRDEHVYSTPSVSLTVVAVVTPVHFRVNTKTQVFVGFPRYEIINTCWEGLRGLRGFLYHSDIVAAPERHTSNEGGVYIIYCRRG